MSGGDQDHPLSRGRALRRAARAAVLVLALVVAGFAAYRHGPLDGWIHDLASGVSDDGSPAAIPSSTAEVPPPVGLQLPSLATPAPVAGPATPGRLDQKKVRRALRPFLTDPVLGRHVLAAVVGLDGTPVYHRGGDTARPASTTKLLTTLAALHVLGPEHRFATRVLAGGPGRIVLVGGGDPFLDSARDPVESDAGESPSARHADIDTLARLTARRLVAQGRTQVRLGFDDTLFSGPAVNPTWPADYLADDVTSPITALWVDEARNPVGYGYVADPSLAAAQTFARELAAAGVRVIGDPVHGHSSGGRELARVESPPLRQIVERILLVSDNQAAEVLGHQVGLTVDGTGSFEAGADAVRATLGDLGIDTTGIQLYDGSGLSRRDRVSPQLLVSVLQAAAAPDRPALRTVLTALPVAAFTGSLASRFDDADPAGRGRVRAKTGTLTNVFALAGIATGPDGRPMLFALMADRIAEDDTDRAKQVLDDAAGALGACRCAAAPPPTR